MKPKLIDLDVLDERLNAIHKPTPYQVIDMIADMYRELKEETNNVTTSVRR